MVLMAGLCVKSLHLKFPDSSEVARQGHNSRQASSENGGNDEERTPLSQQELLEVTEDEMTCTTNLKTPSASTLVTMDEPPGTVSTAGAGGGGGGGGGGGIYFASCSSSKPHHHKLGSYLKRHRTFLVSVALCLLAWIVFAVVTLYTVAELRIQCRENVNSGLLLDSVRSSTTTTTDYHPGRAESSGGNLDNSTTRSVSTSGGASSSSPSGLAPPEGVCTTFECVTTAARLIGAMDFSVDPCHDFFNYACANWNKEHIIPDDRTSISTFEVMADKVQIQLRRLLEEPDNNVTSEAMKKAKLMFSSCMNVSEIEQVGHGPLNAVVARYGNWPVASSAPEARSKWVEVKNMSVEELIATIHRDLNIVIVVDQWVGPDDKDSKKHILQIDQPDFALPSRDHYISPQWSKDLDAYLQYMIDVAKIFGHVNNKTVRKEMKAALQVEIDLANFSAPEAERQATRSALYNKLTLQQLQDQIPEFNWTLYFKTLLGYELDMSVEIVAYGLPYLKSACVAIKKIPKRALWNYAVWRVVMEFVPHMSSAYLGARADFHKVLMGVSQQRARWQQCIDFVNDKMGMATGAMFIRDHFKPESKDKALEMIHMIRKAFVELVNEQTWMEKETSEKAKEKATFMNEKIGYPNFLVNDTALNAEFDTLVVNEDVFMINVARLYAFQTKRNLARLNEPVDPERWTTSGPAIVNAFYNPNKNDIVFPAGILQPPFYSASYPHSMNFGGIGVVVGHEISHGFDMKGRQFDRHGNLKEWWNNATAQAFYKKADCFSTQYSEYIVDEVGLHIDGA
ncbi:Membrane metallo-endopeptidase-like 1 [Hypsibius exemplaris]|nr:Membrane metallo-endopeptidase-like 1 [Hypsibius exemplaris]